MDRELQDKIQQEIFSCYGIPPELFNQESPLKKSIEIQEKIFKEQHMKINICPYCLGTGKLKAMQKLDTFNGGSIRGEDTTVKCKHCNGSGLIK